MSAKSVTASSLALICILGGLLSPSTCEAEDQNLATNSAMHNTQLGSSTHNSGSPRNTRTDTLLSVPFYWQDGTNWCWATSASMVLRYYGYNRKPWQIAADFDKAADSGLLLISVPLTLIPYLEDYYDCGNAGSVWESENRFSFDPGLLSDLRAIVDSGHPVWFAMSGSIFADEGHVVVIVGHDENGFFIHDPSGAAFNEPGVDDVNVYVTDQLLLDTMTTLSWVEMVYATAGMSENCGGDPHGLISIEAAPWPSGSIVFWNQLFAVDTRTSSLDWNGEDPLPGYYFLDNTGGWYLGESATSADSGQFRVRIGNASFPVEPLPVEIDLVVADSLTQVPVLIAQAVDIIDSKSTISEVLTLSDLADFPGGDYVASFQVRESVDGGLSYDLTDSYSVDFSVRETDYAGLSVNPLSGTAIEIDEGGTGSFHLQIENEGSLTDIFELQVTGDAPAVFYEGPIQVSSVGPMVPDAQTLVDLVVSPPGGPGTVGSLRATVGSTNDPVKDWSSDLTYVVVASGTNILTVTHDGSGAGSVTSNPPGIACGSQCSTSFPSGSTVTLTAAPFTGSTFGGWSGDCSGTGSCVVDMTTARTVNATFLGSGGVSATASPNPQNVDLPSTISVTVTDGAGQQVSAGTDVTFSSSYPGFFSGNNCTGTCNSPWTTQTDSNGDTWIRFTSSSVGTANITIESPDAVGTILPIEFVNPNADLYISISVSYVSGGGSSSTYELEAVVTNGLGSPISGERVDFTTTSGTLSPTYDFTGPTGVADVNLTVTSSGDVTVTATAGGNQAATTFYAQVGGGDPPEMQPTQSFTMDADVHGVDFSTDGSTLVAGSYGGDLKAWNTSNWSSKWTTTSATDDRIAQVDISPNGSYVLVAMNDGVDIHYASNGGFYCYAANSDTKGIAGAWASDSTYLETSFDFIYRHSSVCSSGTLTSTQPLSGHGFERAGHMDYSPARGWASVATDDGDLIVLTSSGSSVANLDLTASSANAFDSDFSVDGTQLAGTAWNVVKVYNTSTWSFSSYSPPNLSDFRYGVAFVDNDTKLAIGGVGRVEVVDLSGGASVRYGTVNGNAVELSWNQATEELAVGTSSGNLYVFRPLETPIPPDEIGPTISVSHPSDGSSTNDPSLTTTGRVTDASGVASFTINGTSVSLDGSGNFSHVVTLSEGSNVITYWAQDSAPAANQSTTTRTVTLNVDHIAPVISGSTVTPSAGAPGTVFTIQSTVVDGDTGVASVEATIRDSGSAVIATIPMSSGVGDTYSGVYDSTGAALDFYLVDITAVDSSPQSNSRTVASATGFAVSAANNPPHLPSAPTPTNGATGIGVSTDLNWTGGDPDTGDTVTYDVYLEAGDATPDALVCDDAPIAACNPPSDLNHDSYYYWQVVARDDAGATTDGPVWSFTTESGPNPDEIFSDGFEAGSPDQWDSVVGYNPGPTGPVGYWPLDGDALDATGNGYDGTPFGDVSFTPGAVGQAAAFDGIGDYIQIAGQVAYGDDLSICGWMLFSGPAENDGSLLFQKWANTNLAFQGLNYAHNGQYVHFDLSDYSSPWYLRHFITLQQDRWYHLCATATPGRVKIYLDGEMVEQGAMTGHLDHGNFMGHFIGGAPQNLFGPYSHNGLIDEVFVYDREISAAEVQAHYEEYTGGGAVLLEDDFNDGDSSGWETFASGWLEADGVYHATNTSANTPVSSVWSTGYGWTDYSIEADVTPLSSYSPSGAALLFRFTSPYPTTDFCQCSLSRGGGGVALRLACSGLEESTVFAHNVGQTYRLKATADGSVMSCEIVGVPGTQLTGDAPGASTAGTVGFRATHIPADFDNVIVRGLGGSAVAPEGYYPFEGTADDASGNGNHGTPDGVTWTTGHTGQAAEFANGTSSAVAIPRSLYDGLGNTAYVEAWVYPTSLPSSSGSIFRKRGAYNDWGISMMDDGRVYAVIYGYVGTGGTNGWQGLGIVSPDPLPLNTWTKVSSWYDGTTLTLSFDGVPVVSDTNVLPLVWDSPQCPSPQHHTDGCYYGSWIGATSDYSFTQVNPAHTFPGIIDEVKIASEPTNP